MQTMVPIESVVVVRDGKRVTPPIGKGFNFTDAEVRDIKRIRQEAIRKPINESERADSQTDVRTAAGRVAEGGNDMRDENLDAEQHEDALDVGGSGSGEAEDDGLGAGDNGGSTDEEIEERNEQAADEQAHAKVEKAVAKVAGKAATARASGRSRPKPAPEKIDDL